MSNHHTTRLKELQAHIKTAKYAGFVVPSNDEFQSEFCPAYARRLQWLTGFSGSNGVAVILENKAAFFTDGRYTLQAKSEVSIKHYEHYNINETKPWLWAAENISKNHQIAIDPWLHNTNNANLYQQSLPTMYTSTNPIDNLWQDKPQPPNDKIHNHLVNVAGKRAKDKIAPIRQYLKDKHIDAYILTSPDSVCWLLNIRGNDVPCTPLILTYAIIHKKGQVELFLDRDRIPPSVMEQLIKVAKISLPKTLEKSINQLKGKVISFDPSSAPIWFSNTLNAQKIIPMPDPCLLPKACKNNIEINGAKMAHLQDGIAVTEFLCWLENELPTGKVTELSATEKLYTLRSEKIPFKGNSFDTIAGFGANGAIVHYHSTPKTNKTLKGQGLFLIDSGGQYEFGTTDITRTIAIGKPTAEQKRNFTLVLKGHIALATAVFAQGTTGSQLDALARQYLWQHGLDYDHGTGHGVGSYLGVHEGPQRISKVHSNIALQPGMIISNEPGYYKEGKYGIRIENLVLVIERTKQSQGNKKFYGFETLTLAPIDTNLLDHTILNDSEQQWLQNYHQTVSKKLHKHLSPKTRKWLSSM